MARNVPDNEDGGEDKEQSAFHDVNLDASLDEELEDNYKDLGVGTGTFGPRSPYRPYLRTTAQYIPGQRFSRYRNALKNLIPVRKKQRSKDFIAVDKAGLFSSITFSWMSQYMYKAYKKGLYPEDIPHVSPFDSSDLNAQRLELLWQKEVTQKGRKDASFGRVVWRFVRTRVLISSLLFSLSLAIGFVSPTIFMRKLLEYAEDGNGTAEEGVKWAVCLTLAEFFRIFFFSWNWGMNYRTAVRLRSACLTMLYKRVIRLSNFRDVGQLINIFGTDSQRIFDMVLFGPMIVGGPLMMACGVGYVLWLLGPWALLGMLVFLVFYPVQYGLSRLIGYLRGKTVSVGDKRIRLVTEVLESIKLIKMYTWEKFFSKKLLDVRAQESSWLMKAACCHSLSISLAPTVPVISAIVTFLVHVAAGNSLTAAQAFPLAACFGNQLKDSLSRIREATKSYFDASVASLRIKGVLSLEDIGWSPIRPIDKSQAVCINNGTFSYPTAELPDSRTKKQNKKIKRKDVLASKTEKEHLQPLADGETQYLNVLFDINIQLEKGQLVGVCGPVGAGKSSLLLAALGQMRIAGGHVARDGLCGYVSQEPWILNATLKDNILFGEKFRAKRYYDVLYSCCLTEDINSLPGGDETEIGERGINLSGGQKQRVCLARAVYANRDIYFLDDPLSAVDAHVGVHLFEKCIRTALKEKTVVFVTHQVQFLKHCDEIYVMKDGRVVEHGKHTELVDKRHEYYSMMQASMAGSDQNYNDKEEEGEVPADGLQRNSVGSAASIEEITQNPNAAGQQLTTAEKTERGSVKAQTYQRYISAAGGVCVLLCVVVMFLLNVGSTAFSSWWLAMWISAGGGNVTVVVNNQTVLSRDINDNPDLPTYQLVYAAMIAVILATSLLRGLVITKVTLRASNNLHNSLFKRMMCSPMSFFETTPTGRIQNLFSRDMDEVDSRLPINIESMLQNIWTIVFAIMFICLAFPWFIIPLLVLAVVYYFISKIFRVAVRDLKRLETVSRSPIFSWVSTTVQGLTSIHAFNKEGEFTEKFMQMFDENTTCLFLSSIAMRWLAVRVDSLAVCTVCVTSFLVIFLHGQVPAALAGLALAYSSQISGVFQYTTRLLSETEARFISVERINAYYESLKTEGGSGKKIKPTSSWPLKGIIRFQNVYLRYREGLPHALKNVSFTVLDGEKIGIVGRTGSGKSSLVAALFRLVELSDGKIKIDGMDIADIDLEQLRSRIAVIPQDPVLFSGTVRSNLDPFSKNSDQELWDVLEKVGLKGKVSAMAGQLAAAVGQAGGNLSVGERQLLCLARALLRNCKVLVLDEATASVDPGTAAAVQETVGRVFEACTVLVVAHRLSAVQASDRVLVMGSGEVMEFDTPTNLLLDPSSHFYKMMAVTDASVGGQRQLQTSE
ncbi:ATP-binding cassette sub-family C member 5-like isoform X1 [Bacillus rossius redtenbacheri]|uniref:ATP-binding cassette sub-family C member 5-like isoform X1 n=1 Tax=Bacillus rossius redtenbacheri TaxID=93214 RepID=UPI002FDC9B5B